MSNTVNYSPATIARCRTILERSGVTIAPTIDADMLARAITALVTSEPVKVAPKPKATRKPQPQPAKNAPKKADWTVRPASARQLARINACERALGYRLSTAQVVGTAGQASALYTSLKQDMSDAGLHF